MEPINIMQEVIALIHRYDKHLKKFKISNLEGDETQFYYTLDFEIEDKQLFVKFGSCGANFLTKLILFAKQNDLHFEVIDRKGKDFEGMYLMFMSIDEYKKESFKNKNHRKYYDDHLATIDLIDVKDLKEQDKLIEDEILNHFKTETDSKV